MGRMSATLGTLGVHMGVQVYLSLKSQLLELLEGKENVRYFLVITKWRS